MGSLLPRVAAPLALLLLATGAFAQGVADQQNDPSGGSGFGCGATTPLILNGTIHQSFVPTVDNLVAVELRLQAGSSFPAAGTTTTASIRAGSSTGTVLGTATASVAGPLSQGTQALVRFDFTQISLTAGSTYLIEWTTPPTTILTWVGQGGNPYPAGTAHSCSGNVWPVAGTDFNFITYYAVPPPPPPEPPAEEPPAEEPPAEEPPVSSPPAEEPPTCESLLEQLRAAVGALEINKFKQCALNNLLERAQRELGRDRPKAASALVLAVELNVRVLARLGVISDDAAQGILDLAADFRACLGIKPKSYDDWRSYWFKKWHRDGDDDDDRHHHRHDRD